MKDASEQLQALYLSGFELRAFERYPNTIGITRGSCVILLVHSPDGLRMLGAPGWLIDDQMAVLTTVAGKLAFQFKDKTVHATEERRRELDAFRTEVVSALAA